MRSRLAPSSLQDPPKPSCSLGPLRRGWPFRQPMPHRPFFSGRRVLVQCPTEHSVREADTLTENVTYTYTISSQTVRKSTRQHLCSMD